MNDTTKPLVKLIGQDGNANMIVGVCARAAIKAGWPDEHWLEVYAEMTSGNYDDLLATVMRYFEIE